MNYCITLVTFLVMILIFSSSANQRLQDHHHHLIFPGTKWCGMGNIAENYDDLGEDADTDKCCRTHDHCPECIEAGQTKYDLVNKAHYTRVLCSCDEEFYRCLHKNIDEKNSTNSALIGYIYFDKLQTQCFMKEHLIVDCKKRTKNSNHCEEYLLDSKSEIKWQWFDVPLFEKN